MARIPYVEPENAAPAVREVLDQLPVKLNIFKVMAHAETNFRPLLRLGTSILGQQKLEARLRELAILRVAKLSDAEYEWVQHVPIAKHVGVTDAQVEALERGDLQADAFGELEQVLLRFTDEVVQEVGPSDATFAAASKHLSNREIVELVIAIGFYMTVARLMETVRIDLDPPAGTAVVDEVSRRS
ncbi:MAG: carboxymuconolactone decarboxylase family protein [Myxococcota bacterium]